MDRAYVVSIMACGMLNGYVDKHGEIPSADFIKSAVDAAIIGADAVCEKLGIE